MISQVGEIDSPGEGRGLWLISSGTVEIALRLKQAHSGAARGMFGMQGTGPASVHSFYKLPHPPAVSRRQFRRPHWADAAPRSTMR